MSYPVLPARNSIDSPQTGISRRLTSAVQITVGNTAGEHQTGGDRPTFAWQFFANIDSPESAAMIEKIVVGLHPSFNPSSKTLRIKPGEKTARTETMRGWGVFEVDVIIHWDKAKVHTPSTTHLTWMLQATKSEASDTSQVVIQTEGEPQQSGFLFSSNMTPPARSRQQIPTVGKEIQVNTGAPKDDKHTVIAMVVDRSGSMRRMADEVHGGCNAYLEEQRKSDTEDGAHSTVIFTRFDNVSETIYDGVDLGTMPPISPTDVNPRGSTALYDAIGDTLQRTAAVVNELPKMPSVTVFILTDGAENASQRWTKSQITTQITKLQHESIGWDFYFAAANQDGMKEGAALGMDREQCTTWATSKGKCSYAFKQSNIAYNRKKKMGIKGYTQEERLQMA